MSRQLSWAWIASAVAVAAIAGVSCSATGRSFVRRGSAPAETGRATARAAARAASSAAPAAAEAFTRPAAAASAARSRRTACDSSCPAAGGTCTNNIVHPHREPRRRRHRRRRASSQAGGSADPTLRVALPVRQDGVPARPPAADAAVRGRRARRPSTCTSRARASTTRASSSRRRAPAASRSRPPSWTAHHQRGDRPTQSARQSRSPRSPAARSPGPSPRRGPSRRAACAAPSTTRPTARRSSGGLGSVGIMKIAAGRHAADGAQEGLRQRLPHRERRRLDARRRTRSLSARAASSYDLKNGGRTINAAGRASIFTYGGIYPDGCFVDVGDALPHVAQRSPRTSTTRTTGANIAAPAGTASSRTAARTAFSPDGKQLAFIHEDKDSGHTLAMMDFDESTQDLLEPRRPRDRPEPHARRGRRSRPTASGSSIHAGSNAAFETDSGAPATSSPSTSRRKTVARLDALDGYTGPASAPTCRPTIRS